MHRTLGIFYKLLIFTQSLKLKFYSEICIYLRSNFIDFFM